MQEICYRILVQWNSTCVYLVKKDLRRGSLEFLIHYWEISWWVLYYQIRDLSSQWVMYRKPYYLSFLIVRFPLARALSNVPKAIFPFFLNRKMSFSWSQIPDNISPRLEQIYRVPSNDWWPLFQIILQQIIKRNLLWIKVLEGLKAGRSLCFA